MLMVSASLDDVVLVVWWEIQQWPELHQAMLMVSASSDHVVFAVLPELHQVMLMVSSNLNHVEDTTMTRTTWNYVNGISKHCSDRAMTMMATFHQRHHVENKVKDGSQQEELYSIRLDKRGTEDAYNKTYGVVQQGMT